MWKDSDGGVAGTKEYLLHFLSPALELEITDPPGQQPSKHFLTPED